MYILRLFDGILGELSIEPISLKLMDIIFKSVHACPYSLEWNFALGNRKVSGQISDFLFIHFYLLLNVIFIHFQFPSLLFFILLRMTNSTQIFNNYWYNYWGCCLHFCLDIWSVIKYRWICNFKIQYKKKCVNNVKEMWWFLIILYAYWLSKSFILWTY
jgi:hypothetical protein